MIEKLTVARLGGKILKKKMIARNKAMLSLAVILGGLGLMIAVTTGCGRKAAEAPPKAEGQANSVPSASPVAAKIPTGPVPQAMPAASVAIASGANADEAAGKLTMELRKYVAYTRNIPKNFEDFVAHHPMKYPPAPAGKKYVIEDGKVVVR